MEGYLAAITFLIFSGTGTAAQVIKTFHREKAGEPNVCDGLTPTRELFTYGAFLTFSLSAVTRSYTDFYILLSRIPVVALATIILWQLKKFTGAKNVFYCALIGNTLLVILTICSIAKMPTYKLASIIDVSVVLVSILLFWGKINQARSMWIHKRFAGVSVIRELGTMIKDLFGLYYSFIVGSELFWISVTHAMSFLTSFLILCIKAALEFRSR